MDEWIEDERYEMMLAEREEEERERDRHNQLMDALEGYCDFCEEEGHTFRTCPRRDDAELWDENS